MNSILREYEVLFRETRNPLFAWKALAKTERGEPLPEWLWDYLVGAARSMHALGQPAWDDVPRDRIESRHAGVLDLCDQVSEEKARADDAVGLVGRALGFQRGSNYNAFKEMAKLQRGFAYAWQIDVTRAGSKQEAARREIESHLAKGNNDREAESYKSQVNRRVRTARRLWRKQRSKSGASA